MSIDRIGLKGSASTVVRTNLYRKAARDAARIKSKKVVIRRFSARSSPNPLPAGLSSP